MHLFLWYLNQCIYYTIQGSTPKSIHFCWATARPVSTRARSSVSQIKRTLQEFRTRGWVTRSDNFGARQSLLKNTIFRILSHHFDFFSQFSIIRCVTTVILLSMKKQCDYSHTIFWSCGKMLLKTKKQCDYSHTFCS